MRRATALVIAWLLLNAALFAGGIVLGRNTEAHYLGPTWELSLESGNLVFVWNVDPFFIFGDGWYTTPATRRFEWRWPSFHCQDYVPWGQGPFSIGQDSRRTLVIPLWFVCLLSSCVPVLWLRIPQTRRPGLAAIQAWRSRHRRGVAYKKTDTDLPAVGAIFVAVLFSFILGTVGGAILAGPFWFAGFIVGATFAPPVGLVIGLFAAFLRWPARCIVDACGCQFVGALALGFGALAFDGDPADYANIGQIAGAAVGVLVAQQLHRRSRRRPCECLKCGYNLTGNISAVCPECGEQI